MLRIAPLVIAYALWGMFVISWAVFGRFSAATTATPSGRSSGRVSRWGTGGRGERLYSLVIALGMVILVLAPVTRAAGRVWVNPPALDWALLLVMAGGIAWCWWARLHLGRLWSSSVTRKDGHHVVDTGPYRLVRHPMYTGFIVIYLGMALICATALALLAVPVMTLGLWLKARVEEKFLIEELGAAVYGHYRARTPMLMPRVLRQTSALTN
jgi:protein-S-isoprenylcysteine O-methyltransferase Ste14